MVKYLKKAEPELRQHNRDLVERVRAMLDDIEENRDAAVRRYAKDLDRWERPQFRVSEAEIDAARKAMSAVFKDDFAFCKKQVTEFAKRQRDSLQEFEAEVGPGIMLRVGIRLWPPARMRASSPCRSSSSSTCSTLSART